MRVVMCLAPPFLQEGLIMELGRQDDPDLVQSGSCT